MMEQKEATYQYLEEAQGNGMFFYTSCCGNRMYSADNDPMKLRQRLYMSLEQDDCNDMGEIKEVMSCDADAETKCKMISNILTAKPHYFKEQEPCEDCISRDMALEKMADYVASGYAVSAEDFEEYSRIICQLPPVTPQAKTGHWIEHPKDIYAHLVCDKCLSNAPYDCQTNYCPNCGAKMEGE